MSFRLGTFIEAVRGQTFPDPEVNAETVISLVKKSRFRIVQTPDHESLGHRNEDFGASPDDALEQKDGTKIL